jgi:HPt (histidine-containing phosphotransfer) domain-containing protein
MFCPTTGCSRLAARRRFGGRWLLMSCPVRADDNAEANTRVLTIINSILDFSKIEAARGAWPPEWTAVAKPIRANVLFQVIEEVLPVTSPNSPSVPPTAAAEAASPAAAQAPAGPAFDEHAALRRLGGDTELFAEVVQIFLDTGPEMISSIEQAIGAGDLPATHAAAHALKGSASNFEALAVVRAALNLEMAAREKDPGRVQVAWAELRRQMPILLAALAAHAAQATPSAH